MAASFLVVHNLSIGCRPFVRPPDVVSRPRLGLKADKCLVKLLFRRFLSMLTIAARRKASEWEACLFWGETWRATGIAFA